MSCSQSPLKTALPREVLKWLLSLDLSFQPNNVRRDFSSGFLMAEILSRYYSQDFPEHLYDRGASLSVKQRNWSQIQMSLQKQNVHLMKDVIDGVIHCKPGAAELLLQEVYTVLTNRSIRAVQGPDSDFTDRQYQQLLPTPARSTASWAIKNNLSSSEILAEPDVCTNQRKAAEILLRHLQSKAAERALHPGRFKVQPNLGQLAAKNVPPSPGDDESFASSGDTTSISESTQSGAAVSFKKITVQQPVRRSLLHY